MSLFRSASGPSGLSINTTAANTPGSTSSQAPAAGGLFGSATNNATGGGGGGGLFGNATGTTTGGGSGGGGLFGSKPTTTTTSAPSGLFGGASNTSAAGGLFGGGSAANPTTTTTTGGGGGGLFGSAAASTAPSTGLGGGLFGASGTQNTSTAGSGGGLFGAGAGATTAQPQAQTSSSMFGNATGQTNTAGGLFAGGATNTQQQQQQGTAGGGGGLFFGGSNANQNQNQNQNQTSGGLFGNMNQAGNQQQQQQQQPATTGLLGQATGFFNAGQGQQPQVISATQVNYDSLQGRTRFEDLAKPVADDMVTLDNGIERVKTMQTEIAAFLPKHREMVDQLTRDVNYVELKFKRVERVLKHDVAVVNALKEATKSDVDSGQLTFSAVENLKLPPQYHTTNLFSTTTTTTTTPSGESGKGLAGKGGPGASDKNKTVGEVANLIALFNRAVVDLEARHEKLTEYRNEIANHLPNVENGLYERIRALRDGYRDGDGARSMLAEVLATIQTLHGTILQLASECVQTRDKLEEVSIRLPPIGVRRPDMK